MLNLRLGTFLIKHLRTPRQLDLLKEFAQKIEELKPENQDFSERVRDLHVKTEIFVDRGSRKSRLTAKEISNNLILWSLFAPIAVAQIGLKALDSVSLLRYKSPLKIKNKNLPKALEAIFKSLDKIISLEKDSRVDQKSKLLLIKIKNQIIHELRPLFIKEKMENLEDLIKRIEENLTNKEQIKEILKGLNPRKITRDLLRLGKIDFDGEGISSACKEFTKAIKVMTELIETSGANEKVLRENLRDLQLIFNDFDLFFNRASKVSALLLNLSSQQIFKAFLGIPGIRASAFLGQEKNIPILKNGPDVGQREVIKSLVTLLDALYDFKNEINQKYSDSDTRSPYVKLLADLNLLITKLEVNIFPIKNLNNEYKKYLHEVISSDEVKNKQKIGNLLKINDAQDFIEYLTQKSPELLSQIAMTYLIFDVNKKATDETRELEEYFDEKILKDKDGNQIIENNQENILYLNRLKEFILEQIPSDLRAFTILLVLATGQINPVLTRRDLFKRGIFASLAGGASSQMAVQMRNLKPGFLEMIKNKIPKILDINQRKESKMNENDIKALTEMIQKDENFIMRLVSYTLNSSGIGPLVAYRVFNNPGIYENLGRNLDQRLEQYLDILSNLVSMKK